MVSLRSEDDISVPDLREPQAHIRKANGKPKQVFTGLAYIGHQGAPT